MNIVLEDGLSTISGTTGIGRHTAGLSRGLSHIESVEQIRVQPKPAVLSALQIQSVRRMAYIIWSNSAMWVRRKVRRSSVIHFTNYYVPLVRWGRSRVAVTIHDLACFKVPESLPISYASYLRYAVRRALQRADLVFTVSETVKGEILELDGSCASRIHNIGNGVDLWAKPCGQLSEECREIVMKAKPYLLCVGTLEARKNVASAVFALDELRYSSERWNVSLVLAGRRGYKYSSIRSSIQVAKSKDNIWELGFVSDCDLQFLYANAAILLAPSFYEGFDIPVVEAFWAGVPVVASSIDVHKEIGGDAAVYYGSPEDHSALASTVGKVLRDRQMRETCIRLGLERAKQYDWRSVGERYLNALLNWSDGRV